ncbi:fibronectin type III domain-containing protein [Demequina sp. NBRC 110056]|uniref:fibronectin type III domain-containing protein n=1 Tax=Demequina sp. NBRC 110056 TaxID=1570345 RepID=UPI000A0426D0|nr:fibronectin type III domain-containing protein [Demequina sp. NBRC 110056]
MSAFKGYRLASAQRGIVAVMLALLLATVVTVAGSRSAGADEVEGAGVDLRVLVLGDSDPFNGPHDQADAIMVQLEREGVPYTVVNPGDPGRPVLDEAFLVDNATGRGRFQAVVMQNQNPGLATEEVQALALYERLFGVRRVNAYVYPGTATGHAGPPADGGTLDGAELTVTDAGLAGPFTYLNGSLTVDDFDPAVQESYGYLVGPAEDLPDGETFTSLIDATHNGLTGSLMGVYSHGYREELYITANYNQYQQWFNELAHGIVTWMTRGINLGHHRNYFSLHVDDIFVESARWNVDGNCTPGDVVDYCGDPSDNAVRMTVDDVSRLVSWQNEHDFTFDMYYNAQGSDQAIAENGSDPLTDAFLAVKDQFFWSNHTYSHPFLGCIQVQPTEVGQTWRCGTEADLEAENVPFENPEYIADGDYEVSDGILWFSQDAIEEEIGRNVTWGLDHNLPNFDPFALVTGEHSGLLTTPQQPVDNPYFSLALASQGITLTASDASRERDPRPVGSSGAVTVPRYPMNIFYNVATYREEVDEYNWIYTTRANGGSGICEDNPLTSTCITPLPNANDTEAEASFLNYIVPIEVRNAYRPIVTNDPRPFYSHQGNLAEDGLILTVVEEILEQYRASYDTAKSPLITTEMRRAAVAMNRQDAWEDAQDDVVAYIDGSGVHVSSPSGALVPLTVPAGTTVNGPELSSYDGALSGWFTSSAADTVVAVPAEPFGGYVGHDVPAAPTDVVATPRSEKVTVTWSAPATTGNSPITGYGLEYSTDGGGSWTSVFAPEAGNLETSHLVTGLTNGTSYVFRVVAVNALGASAWSASSAAATPQRMVPTKVTGATAFDVTETSARVSWEAPDNGGSTIIMYQVRRSSDGGSTWLPGYAWVMGQPAPTALTVTGLTPGTEYVFQVVARNSLGWSPGWSASSEPVSTIAVEPPSAPLSVVATARSEKATVTWDAPATEGTSPLTGYGIEYSSDGGSSWTSVLAPSAGVLTTSHTVTGLTNGTSYMFRVVAVSAVGPSEWSAPSAAVTPQRMVPTKVTGATTSNVTATSVRVSWEAPDNGGSTIIMYQVRRSNDGGTTWLPGYAWVMGQPAPTSLTVSGLTPGTEYVFQVVARNAMGWSPGWSASSAPVTTVLPLAPMALSRNAPLAAEAPSEQPADTSTLVEEPAPSAASSATAPTQTGPGSSSTSGSVSGGSSTVTPPAAPTTRLTLPTGWASLIATVRTPVRLGGR